MCCCADAADLTCVVFERYVRYHSRPARAARAAMALSKLSGDEQRILFTQLCNVLEPRIAVF